jgi:hypothetical protein
MKKTCVTYLSIAACNILVEGTADVYTLRNYGKHVNCSVTTLFPARVKVLSLSVGLQDEGQETGTVHKVSSDKCPLPPGIWKNILNVFTVHHDTLHVAPI